MEVSLFVGLGIAALYLAKGANRDSGIDWASYTPKLPSLIGLPIPDDTVPHYRVYSPWILVAWFLLVVGSLASAMGVLEAGTSYYYGRCANSERIFTGCGIGCMTTWAGLISLAVATRNPPQRG
jgi:hypothetical protein